jgi:hypothetical protein
VRLNTVNADGIYRKFIHSNELPPMYGELTPGVRAVSGYQGQSGGLML